MGPFKSCIPLNFLPVGWESHTHTGFKGNLQGQGELLAQTQESLSKGRFPVSTQGPWLHKGINNPDKMEAKCGQDMLPGRETRKPGRREGEAKEMWVHFV